MSAVPLEPTELRLISLALVMPTVLALVMPTVLTVLRITSTHLASSPPKKSNDIVRNLDFTTHLNYKNQTK